MDARIRTLIENCAKTRQRALLVLVGDKGRDQVVNLHYMLSKASVKARPTVLWCYKKELHLSRCAGEGWRTVGGVGSREQRRQKRTLPSFPRDCSTSSKYSVDTGAGGAAQYISTQRVPATELRIASVQAGETSLPSRTDAGRLLEPAMHPFFPLCPCGPHHTSLGSHCRPHTPSCYRAATARSTDARVTRPPRYNLVPAMCLCLAIRLMHLPPAPPYRVAATARSACGRSRSWRSAGCWTPRRRTPSRCSWPRPISATATTTRRRTSWETRTAWPCYRYGTAGGIGQGAVQYGQGDVVECGRCQGGGVGEGTAWPCGRYGVRHVVRHGADWRSGAGVCHTASCAWPRVGTYLRGGASQAGASSRALSCPS